jgi:hypothetical protein
MFISFGEWIPDDATKVDIKVVCPGMCHIQVKKHVGIFYQIWFSCMDA